MTDTPNVQDRLTRRTPLLAGTAVAATVTMVAGIAAAALVGDGGTGTRTTPVMVATAGSGAQSGAGVTNVVESGTTAPLRRVVPPDLLAVAGGTVGAAKAKRIAKLARVRDVMIVSAGAVQLQGRQVNAFAVDPAAFRSWTPPATARSQDLWAALADDRFVVSTAAAKSLGLQKGSAYTLVGRSMPHVTMGGSGQLGLPGVDMLVSRETGREMGLIPNLAVLVNAPGADPAKLGKQLRQIIGRRAQVLNLHERKNQPSGGAGTAGSYLELYQRAARTCPGLSWTVLAAIGQIESGHGRNSGPSSAGALGPMQFMPATWKAYGVDGDGDRRADIMNPYDAVPGAAGYLCANGAGKGGRKLYTAIWHYNHADWYVRQVLALARSYAREYA